MIDLVYILGAGSICNNDEIVFSIRSVEKYATGWRQIFIAGEPPPRKNMPVIHIPVGNALRCPDANIANKCIAAALNPKVSDPFVMMCDDIYLLQPIDLNAMPAWWARFPDRHMRVKPGDKTYTFYSKCVQETYAKLKDAGVGEPRFYDLHTPILIFKKSLLRTFDYFRVDCIYTFKSLYGNFCREIWSQQQYLHDVRIVNRPHAMDDWPCCSTPPRILPSVYVMLDSLFPMAKWEVDHAT